jgi:hypothetical protein
MPQLRGNEPILGLNKPITTIIMGKSILKNQTYLPDLFVLEKFVLEGS